MLFTSHLILISLTDATTRILFSEVMSVDRAVRPSVCLSDEEEPTKNIRNIDIMNDDEEVAPDIPPCKKVAVFYSALITVGDPRLLQA